jgi:hypothetical protein
VPDGARVLVDGATAPFAPGRPLLLSVGEHSLEVQAEGHASEQRVLSLKTGGAEMLSVRLRRLPSLGVTAAAAAPAHSQADIVPSLTPPSWQLRGASAPKPSPGAAANPLARRGSTMLPSSSTRTTSGPASPAADTAPRGTTKRSRSAAWWLTGISGVLLVGGAVLTGLGFGAISSVEGAASGSRWSEVESDHERSVALTGVGLTLDVAGTVGILSGLIWGLRGTRASEPSAKPAHAPPWLRASGRF